MAPGMDACIGAACPANAYVSAKKALTGPFHLLLHGVGINLILPAGISCAIVFQDKGNIANYIPSHTNTAIVPAKPPRVSQSKLVTLCTFIRVLPLPPL